MTFGPKWGESSEVYFLRGEGCVNRPSGEEGVNDGSCDRVVPPEGGPGPRDRHRPGRCGPSSGGHSVEHGVTQRIIRSGCRCGYTSAGVRHAHHPFQRRLRCSSNGPLILADKGSGSRCSGSTKPQPSRCRRGPSGPATNWRSGSNSAPGHQEAGCDGPSALPVAEDIGMERNVGE